MNTNEIINLCLGNLNQKKILDLGIGEGRCSKRFLSKEVEITGVDIVKKELPKEIKFILCNLKDFDFNLKYDLINASLILHFLSKENAIKTISNMQNSTNLNGYNFILTMTPEDDGFKQKPENFYIFENELKELYSKWEIIQLGSFETPIEQHRDSLPPKHHICFILAKKGFF